MSRQRCRGCRRYAGFDGFDPEGYCGRCRPRDDRPAYFECYSCDIAWHAGRVNPAPACCPSCGRPWDSTPLFPPAELAR